MRRLDRDVPLGSMNADLMFLQHMVVHLEPFDRAWAIQRIHRFDHKENCFAVVIDGMILLCVQRYRSNPLEPGLCLGS